MTLFQRLFQPGGSLLLRALLLVFTPLGRSHQNAVFAVADIKPGKVRSGIYRASRASLSDPFSKPGLIEAIGSNDFVEGPAISADENELYYHKRVGNKFRMYKVTR